MTRAVHELIAQTAKGMAGAAYDEWAKDNEFYKHYPSQKFFVRREWKRFIHQARRTLALMLGRPNVTEHMKQHIMHALLLDQTLNPHHKPEPQKQRAVPFTFADGAAPQFLRS